MGRVTFRCSSFCTGSPDVVYATVANIRNALIWGGEQQAEKDRLLTFEGPEGEASVGTQWASTGADPGGNFTDHSVVTAADRPRLFEYRTDGEFAWKSWKKGLQSQTKVIHRYEIALEGGGTRLTYLFRATGPVPMPWWLRAALATPGLRQALLGLSGPKRAVQRGFDNLLKLAESRAR